MLNIRRIEFNYIYEHIPLYKWPNTDQNVGLCSGDGWILIEIANILPHLHYVIYNFIFLQNIQTFIKIWWGLHFNYNLFITFNIKRIRFVDIVTAKCMYILPIAMNLFFKTCQQYILWTVLKRYKVLMLNFIKCTHLFWNLEYFNRDWFEYKVFSLVSVHINKILSQHRTDVMKFKGHSNPFLCSIQLGFI